jgi:hypothetical protein
MKNWLAGVTIFAIGAACGAVAVYTFRSVPQSLVAGARPESDQLPHRNMLKGVHSLAIGKPEKGIQEMGELTISLPQDPQLVRNEIWDFRRADAAKSVRGEYLDVIEPRLRTVTGVRILSGKSLLLTWSDYDAEVDASAEVVVELPSWRIKLVDFLPTQP